MSERSRVRRAVAALGVIATVVAALVVAVPSAAGAARQQCSMTITGQMKSGEFTTTPIVCGASARVSVMSAVAIHYVDLNFGGASLTINGGSCNGGWLNLPAGWVNVISSTSSGCLTEHYDSFNLGGIVQTLPSGGGNLGSLQDKANSVRYT